MFSKNLKYYRLKKNMSKKELASLVQVTPMAISYYENGERKPGMDIIKALAKALDVKISDFKNMSPERIRSTIVHEMAHFMFIWSRGMEDKEIENRATAISGAFLLSESDAKRELGIRRSAITKDMSLICKEYGISMYLLVKRANLFGIITDNTAKDFYMKAGQHGWKRNEPIRINKEEPMLFSQLVFRAVCENEISIQKGAEILKQSYTFAADQCFAAEG